MDAIWDNLVDDGMGENSGVGGFADEAYWSSSEDDSSYVWGQVFGGGLPALFYKDANRRARAVRAF